MATYKVKKSHLRLQHPDPVRRLPPSQRSRGVADRLCDRVSRLYHLP